LRAKRSRRHRGAIVLARRVARAVPPAGPTACTGGRARLVGCAHRRRAWPWPTPHRPREGWVAQVLPLPGHQETRSGPTAGVKPWPGGRSDRRPPRAPPMLGSHSIVAKYPSSCRRRHRHRHLAPLLSSSLLSHFPLALFMSI
jgi:hypothetical protein